MNNQTTILTVFLVIGSLAAGGITSIGNISPTPTKLGAYSYQTTLKNGTALATDTVKNNISKNNLLLDCGMFSCDYKVEITAKQALTFDASTLKGAYAGTGLSIAKTFYQDTRQVQKERPTYKTTTTEECTVNNQTLKLKCKNITNTVQTGTETYNDTENFENTALTTPFLKDETRTYVIRFTKADWRQNADIYHSIYEQDRKDAAWWNVSYTNKTAINCSFVTSGTPVPVTFYLNGQKQIAWTICQANLYLYSNSNTEYAFANDTDEIPMDIKFGQGTNYLPTSVWTGHWNDVYFLNNNTNSETGNRNLSGSPTYIVGAGCYFGGTCINTSTSAGAYIAITSPAFGGVADKYWHPANLTMSCFSYKQTPTGLYSVMFGVGHTTATDSIWAGMVDYNSVEKWHFYTITKLNYGNAATNGMGMFYIMNNGTNLFAYQNTTQRSTIAGTYSDVDPWTPYFEIGGGGPTTTNPYQGTLDTCMISVGSAGSKSEDYMEQIYNASIGLTGYGSIGASEATATPVSIICNTQTTIAQYNGTVMNYTITSIFHNPNAISQTVNLTTTTNGTVTASLNNIALNASQYLTLQSNFTANRNTLDSTFTINTSATGADQSVFSGGNSTIITMILPIDPPSAINLMNNGGKDRCRTPQDIGYWDGRNWSINASWGCNYSNLNLTTKLNTSGITFVSNGTTTFSNSNITVKWFDRLAGDLGTAAIFIFNTISTLRIQ